VRFVRLNTALAGCALLGALLAAPAWAQDAESEPTSDSEPDSESDSDSGPDGAPESESTSDGQAPETLPAPVTGSDRPLAVPGPATDPPGTPSTGRAPVRTTRVPGAPAAKRPPPDRDPTLFMVDAGTRLVWLGPVYAPTGGGLGGRPVFMHASASALLDKNVMTGLSFEAPLNARPGSFPFIAEARVGWWENAFGQPAMRGPFRTLPGVKATYVGVRWVYDHFQGAGMEWSGKSSTGGLVLGYAYAAPFGELTAVTDTQFTLYLLGWNRNAFPVGLLNQRLSLGYDPVFLDVRFRVDPGTGTELSIGLSFQTLLGKRPQSSGG